MTPPLAYTSCICGQPRCRGITLSLDQQRTLLLAHSVALGTYL
uniref:Uncharacterized protein n=1 Tax=Anguilla anguilla TaxID=7936 RepID=A0A0E9TUB9_ANGAN